jgi:transposase
LPPAKAVVADKGYDSEKIRGQTRSKGAIVVIPRKSNSVIDNAYMDGSLYRHRHLVENAFARLKHFRGLATRYDKLKRNDQSGVATVCGFLWLLM